MPKIISCTMFVIDRANATSFASHDIECVYDVTNVSHADAIAHHERNVPTNMIAQYRANVTYIFHV